MVHDQHGHFNDMYLSFFCFLCPGLSLLYIYIKCGLIHSAVFRFSNKFPVHLGVGQLALNRKNVLHTCVSCILMT